MAENRRTLSSNRFYFLISLVTNLIIFLAMILLLIQANALNSIFFLILLLFLASEIVRSIVFARFYFVFSGWQLILRTILFQAPGRLITIVSGAILSGERVLSPLVGILGLYLAGWVFTLFFIRWFGAYLRGHYEVEPEAFSPELVSRLRKWFTISIWILPFLFLLIALLMSTFGLANFDTGQFGLYGRYFIYVWSPVLIVYSWFAVRSLRSKLQDLEEIDQTNPEHIIFVLKMAFSIAPSLFGFTLFVLGGTLVELFAFVLVSYLILAFYFLRREKETPNPAH